MMERSKSGWRGPTEPGEYATLGWLIGDWIEANLIIPDGPQRGTPYLLTREMWQHLFNSFRLNPKAKVHPKYPKLVDGLVYYGVQLRRPQKFRQGPADGCVSYRACFGSCPV